LFLRTLLLKSAGDAALSQVSTWIRPFVGQWSLREWLRAVDSRGGCPYVWALMQ